MGERVSTWRMEVIGGTRQILIKSADDLRALKTLDPRAWAVMSIPTSGVAMDRGFLDAIDTDGDGRIRIPEVLAAIERVESVGVPLETLAWTLSMGTDIGGSATPIGASANVVGTSVAAKSGHPIKWGRYCKSAAPATFIVVTISMIMIFIRYC